MNPLHRGPAHAARRAREAVDTRRTTAALLGTILIALMASAPLAGHAADDALESLDEGTSAASQAPRRQRIGLALSGGAARGLAHVGVLKVLDELRIPVDLVVGTSMGSIVGGLFAVGESPTEIEASIRRIDWSDLFSDKPNRIERSFRRKQDESAEFFNFEFGIERGKLKLPRSFIAGQKLAFAFDEPALHVAGLESFDELTVPFRAVATDLRSGAMVVLDRGSLARALRASMSVPGFFTPVELDDRLLVDGGGVRNLPIDVALEMGADVVIAVDVSEELGARSPDELASLLGLSFQLTTLVVKANTDRVLPLADAVLRPELGDLSVIEFDRVDEAIAAGEAAARRGADSLQQYALSPADYADFMAQRRPTPSPSVIIDTIELDNNSRIDARAVLERLHTEPGTRLDFLRLRRDLADIYDLGSLELVDFELPAPSATPSSKPGATARATGDAGVETTHRTLHLMLNEKTYAPNLMRVGVIMNSDLTGRTRVQALARLTRVEMNRLGAEWRNDFGLGAEGFVRSEWYQPLEFRRSYFVAIEPGYTHTFQDLYRDGERIAEYGIQEALAHVDLGMQVARVGELRTGYFGGWAKTSLRTGDDFPVDEGTQGGWRFRFALDRLDENNFPRHGQIGDIELRLARESLGSKERYDRLDLRAHHFGSWGKNTVFAGGDFGSSFGSDLPPHEEFLLGGFGSMAGIRQHELRGDVLAVARLGYYRPFLSDVDLLGTDVYAAAWIEAGNVWPHPSTVRFADTLYTWMVGVGASTVLGPVYLTYGRTHQGDDTVFFIVGRQIGLN